jgi:hypothetical protein
MRAEDTKDPRPGEAPDDTQAPEEDVKRPGLPDADSVLAEETLTSPKGRQYRILKTNQSDPYDDHPEDPVNDLPGSSEATERTLPVRDLPLIPQEAEAVLPTADPPQPSEVQDPPPRGKLPSVQAGPTVADPTPSPEMPQPRPPPGDR